MRRASWFFRGGRGGGGDALSSSSRLADPLARRLDLAAFRALSVSSPDRLFVVLEDRRCRGDGSAPGTTPETSSHTPEGCTDRFKVYDLTSFADEHPGGDAALLRVKGKDGTEGFYGPQHPPSTLERAAEYFVGVLDGEGPERVPAMAS